MTRSLIRRLGERFRPPRFPSHEVGTVRLDDLAEPVADHAELCAGRREIGYLELAPQGGEVLRPAFLLGRSDPAFPTDPHIVPPARIYRLRGETGIFGKGLFLREGRLVLLDPLKFYELGRLDYPIHRLSVSMREGGATVKVPEGVRRIDEPCLYVAQGGEGVWGHWLVDILPRLVLGLSVPARTRIVLDADAPSWAVPMLRHAGVEPSRVIWHDKFREQLIVPDLYVPSFLRLGPVFSPLTGTAWDRFPRARRQPYAKLYVSRSRLPSGSSIVNGTEIETIARDHGYAIVHPERLSVGRQITAFNGAAAIVGEAGSGLHNSVFAPAGTTVGVLQSEALGQFVQAGIGAIRGQPTGFAFGPAANGERRFSLDPDVFRELLARVGPRTPSAVG